MLSLDHLGQMGFLDTVKEVEILISDKFNLRETSLGGRLAQRQRDAENVLTM